MPTLEFNVTKQGVAVLNQPIADLCKAIVVVEQEIKALRFTYDDPTLERVLRLAKHVIYTAARDRVRMGELTEDDFEQAMLEARCDFDQFTGDIEAKAAFADELE